MLLAVAERRTSGAPEVVADHISKSYGDDVHALTDVSFKTTGGRCTALLGPNGAGKTTLLRIISGLIRDFTGNVALRCGEEIGRTPRIGVLIEAPGVYPYLSVAQNLQFLTSTLQMGGGSSQEVLERVGLSEFANRKASALSSGLLQRLALAQAVVVNPDILLLDEPLTALDPVSQKEIREIVASETRSGKVVVLSSHNLSDVEQLADDVLVLRNGHLVFDGALRELAGDQSWRVLVQDTSAAAAELARRGWSVSIQGSYVQVRGNDVSGAAVTKALVEAGLAPDEVMRTPDDILGAYESLMQDGP